MGADMYKKIVDSGSRVGGIPETVLESLMRINLGPKEDKVRGSIKASGDSAKAFES